MMSSETHLEGSGRLGASEPLTSPHQTRGRVSLLAGAGSGLKQKVRELETTIEFEVKSSRNEADTLKSSRTQGGDNSKKLVHQMKDEVTEYMEKSKVELKKFFVQQKNENARCQQEIQKLKAENTNLQQGLVALQRRIKDLESDVGK